MIIKEVVVRISSFDQAKLESFVATIEGASIVASKDSQETLKQKHEAFMITYVKRVTKLLEREDTLDGYRKFVEYIFSEDHFFNSRRTGSLLQNKDRLLSFDPDKLRQFFITLFLKCSKEAPASYIPTSHAFARWANVSTLRPYEVHTIIDLFGLEDGKEKTFLELARLRGISDTVVGKTAKEVALKLSDILV